MMCRTNRICHSICKESGEEDEAQPKTASGGNAVEETSLPLSS